MSGMGAEFMQQAIASAGVIIIVDLTEERVILAEPDDFTRFSVAIEGEGPTDAVAEIIAASGLGRLTSEGAQVAVDPVALRALAGSSTTNAWDEGFEKMCAYAASKGWVEADGAILAHIEERDA
jgi:hypothetical protein